MRGILSGIAIFSMIGAAAFGQTTTPLKKKATVAKSSAARKKAPIALQSSVSKKHTATSASSRRKAPVKPAVTWRNRQIQPSQDRYKEIQQALAAKGYLAPDQETGLWDQNTANAMKQFQTAQNLDASGKINSLSLIALGLGPKHDSSQLPVAQPAEQSR